MPNLTIEQRFELIQKKLAKAYHGKDNPELVQKAFALNSGNLGHVPSTHQYATEITLNRDIQNFSPFLNFVNVMPRTHQKGGSLMIGSQGRVTQTNDTRSGTERRVNTPKASTANEYEMVKAHSDFGLHDDDIDAMSEFPEWANMYREAFLEAMGNDRIIIGWHGTHHAATSDNTANALLEDVNTGWLELLRQRASSQVLTGGTVAGEIKIGSAAGSDYASLDHLVQDLYQGIPVHRRTPGMAAMIAESIMGYAEGTYYKEQGGTPTEKTHIREKAITGTYGGLDSIPAPYMPQTGIVITGLKRNGQRMSNLSIYWQKQSWRRKVTYEPKLESSVDWNARREAYHIEDLKAIVALDVDKIIFTDHDNAEVTRLPADNWANS